MSETRIDAEERIQNLLALSSRIYPCRYCGEHVHYLIHRRGGALAFTVDGYQHLCEGLATESDKFKGSADTYLHGVAKRWDCFNCSRKFTALAEPDSYICPHCRAARFYR